MWPKSYKDYPKDTPLVQNRVEPGKGIVGCEMSEPNGWGESFHTTKPTPKNSNNGSHDERTHTKAT
jgi:hypothetical protein